MELSCTDADVGRNREANEALKRENDRLKVTSPRLTGLPWLDSPPALPGQPWPPRCPGGKDGEAGSHVSGDSDLVSRTSQ